MWFFLVNKKRGLKTGICAYGARFSLHSNANRHLRRAGHSFCPVCRCGSLPSPAPHRKTAMGSIAVFLWSRRRESNPREPAWEAGAIPLGDSRIFRIAVSYYTIFARFWQTNRSTISPRIKIFLSSLKSGGILRQNDPREIPRFVRFLMF